MTRTFVSAATRDGQVVESGENSSVGGSLDSTAVVFKLGDNAYDRQFRAILSFNTGALPDRAVIVSVTLKIRRASQAGTNPFNTLGDIVVDISKGPFSGNPALELRDFQATATGNAALAIRNQPVKGWYSSDMAPASFAYINLTGVTQFRLQFAKDDNDNLATDLLRFYSGNFTTTPSYRPKLIITYIAP